MLSAQTTANATGVMLTGDFDDFYELYEAMLAIIGEEGEYIEYAGARIHLLAFLYDLRHAYMGNREISLIDNQMTHDIMMRQSVVTSEKNVAYSFRTVWIEMIFIVSILNDFILLHAAKLAETNNMEKMLAPKVMLDPDIAAVRRLQTAVLAEYRTMTSEETYTQFLKSITHFYTYFGGYMTQFIDKLSISYINLANREERLEYLPIFIDQIIHRTGKYPEMLIQIRQTSALHQVPVSQIQFDDESYPQTIDW
ncbi:MAG: hypothetical protein ACE3JK_03705 [Sporolactobacillus sp.]